MPSGARVVTPARVMLALLGCAAIPAAALSLTGVAGGAAADGQPGVSGTLTVRPAATAPGSGGTARVQARLRVAVPGRYVVMLSDTRTGSRIPMGPGTRVGNRVLTRTSSAPSMVVGARRPRILIDARVAGRRAASGRHIQVTVCPTPPGDLANCTTIRPPSTPLVNRTWADVGPSNAWTGSYFSITTDPRGNVFVLGANAVVKVTRGGQVDLNWAPLSKSVGENAIAADARGNVYVAGVDISVPNAPYAMVVPVSRTTPGGTTNPRWAVTYGVGALGLGVDAAGNVYLQGNDAISRISRHGDTEPRWASVDSIWGSGTGAFTSLAVSPRGDVFTVLFNVPAYSVVKVDPSGALTANWGTPAVYSQFAAADARGFVYVLVQGTPGAAVLRYPPGGGPPSTAQLPNGDPTGIVVDQAGNAFVQNSGEIIKVTSNGRVVPAWARAGAAYGGMAMDLAGNIYVPTINGFITKIIQPPVDPPAPTAVAGNARATITVRPEPGGGTPTSYLVTATPGGATCAVTRPLGRCTIDGLANGTSYTFSATASNAAGTSAPSGPSDPVIPAPPAPPAPSPGGGTTPGGTPGDGPTPGAPAAAGPSCTQTFYQQDDRAIAWDPAREAYKVTSRIRIFQDPQASCRTDLTIIYRNSNNKVSFAQLPGSTLGNRTLSGEVFDAPVISWPTDQEMRFTTGDPTGQNRANARLVLVSYVKKTNLIPQDVNDINLVIVRRIPRDPRAPVSSANPMYAQSNEFGPGVGWARVS